MQPGLQPVFLFVTPLAIKLITMGTVTAGNFGQLAEEAGLGGSLPLSGKWTSRIPTLKR